MWKLIYYSPLFFPLLFRAHNWICLRSSSFLLTPRLLCDTFADTTHNHDGNWTHIYVQCVPCSMCTLCSCGSDRGSPLGEGEKALKALLVWWPVPSLWSGDNVFNLIGFLPGPTSRWYNTCLECKGSFWILVGYGNFSTYFSFEISYFRIRKTWK